jgi:hypothetical protein
MPQQLDVYRDWLGITEPARPLNHYQLLRLPKFEDDPAKIRANYRKMNAHVRKYGTGEFQSASQSLLNELAKAMLCLTDAGRKAEYDAALGRTAAAGARRTMEQILIGRKVVDQAQLAKARSLAQTINIDVRDALIQQKLAPADVVMQAYAESAGLPYVDLEDIGVDDKLVPKVPPLLARQHSCAPVMVDDGQVLMASPNPLLPEIEEKLRLLFGMPVRSVVCTPAGINAAIAAHFPKEAAQAQMAAGRSGGPPRAVKSADQPATADKPAAPKPASPKPAGASGDGKRTQKIACVAINIGLMAAFIARYLLSPVPPSGLLLTGFVLAAFGAVAWALVLFRSQTS